MVSDSVKVALRLSAATVAEVDRLAEQAGVNRSEMTRRLLIEAVDDKTIPLIAVGAPRLPKPPNPGRIQEPTVTVVDDPSAVFLGGVGSYVPEPERIPEVEALIRPDDAEVDAAVARHPAGKRRHDGHRTDSRSGGSCSGCRDCRGWSPIVAGGMRCKCGHPVRMH